MYSQHNIIPINCNNISTGDKFEDETIVDDLLDLSEEILDLADVQIDHVEDTNDEANDALLDADPLVIANLLYKIVDLLEDKLKSAMDMSESGVCPQIKPINIFLSKNPYFDFEVIVSKEDSQDALNKLQNFRDEVANKIPQSKKENLL